jgi:hypothetical protein
LLPEAEAEVVLVMDLPENPTTITQALLALSMVAAENLKVATAAAAAAAVLGQMVV